jgi:hypothetical protein
MTLRHKSMKLNDMVTLAIEYEEGFEQRGKVYLSYPNGLIQTFDLAHRGSNLA